MLAYYILHFINLGIKHIFWRARFRLLCQQASHFLLHVEPPPLLEMLGR
jgi:hypothetical protein